MRLLSSKTPWYAAGLAFECLGCGACCAGPDEGYVWVTQEEIAAIAKHLHTTGQAVRRKYVRSVGKRLSLIERAPSRDCIFLVDGGDGREKRTCIIYPVRPAQCRAWPFWPANLASPDAWSAAGRRCAGINRGPRHDFEQIQAHRQAVGG